MQLEELTMDLVKREITHLYKTVQNFTFGWVTVSLYVITISLVWTFALWDATNVINDYYYNNRVTYVKSIEFPNGPNEFVEDTLVCVAYKKSIFELIWTNESAEVKKEITEAYGRNGSTLTKQIFHEIEPLLATDGIPKLTKRQYIHALKIIRMARDLDGCHRSKWLSNDLNFPCPSVETFWTDDQLDKLTASVWRLINGASAKSAHSSLNTFTLNEVCHYIDVPKVITDTVEEGRHQVPLGLLLDDPSQKIANGTTVMQKITFYFPLLTKSFEFLKFPELFNLSVRAVTTSRGVYDRRNLSDTACFGTRVPQPPGDCRDTHYVESVKKHCQCVPYKFQNLTAWNNFRYCSHVGYTRGCMEQVLREMAGFSCEHCLTTQNSYDMQYAPFNDVDNSKLNGSNASLCVSFMTKDKFYARFEETAKNSLSQVIAQVGGDIGFYTGFSVWAFWKFMMFFINTIKSRRYEAQSKKPRGRNSRHHSWFGIAMDYLEDGDKKLKEEHLEAELIDFLKDRVRRLEESTMLTIEKMHSLERQLKNQQDQPARQRSSSEPTVKGDEISKNEEV